MKSTILPSPSPKTRTYPCLLITTIGSVILMTDDHTGTVVYGDETNGSVGTVGYHSTTWYSHDWKPFTGSVKLEN